MLSNSDEFEVKDGKVIIEQSCVAFAIEPIAGNVSRYPVIAIVNGRTSSPLLIESGALHGQGERIKRVEVMIAGDDRYDGERWRVTLQPEESDRREPHHPSDERGRLLAVPPGVEVLFDLDSRVDYTPFVNLFNGDVGAGIDFLVSPADPSTFTIDRATKWDVSRFQRVIFGVEAWGGSSYVPTDNLRGFVWGYGRPTSFDTVAITGCGSVNQFGTGPGGTWPGVSGYVQLGGVSTNVETEFSTLSPALLPCAGFVLETVPGAVDVAKLLDGSYWIRVYALGLHT